MKTLVPKWWFAKLLFLRFSKLSCLRLTVVDIEVRYTEYQLEGRSCTTGFRGEICAMYNHSMLFHESRFVETHCFLFLLLVLYLFLAVVISCLKKSASHIGPLYWFPDKCCLIPGHEPAASPSFLHTTLRECTTGSGCWEGVACPLKLAAELGELLLPSAPDDNLKEPWGSMRFSSSSCLTLASSCLT